MVLWNTHSKKQAFYRENNKTESKDIFKVFNKWIYMLASFVGRVNIVKNIGVSSNYIYLLELQIFKNYLKT